MAKKKSNKFITGAVVGALLGVVSGLLLAPESGKKMRNDIQVKSGKFYRSIMPKIKKMGNMAKEDYDAVVDAMAKTYAKVNKLSAHETKQIVASAKKHWNDFHRHFS